MTIFGQKVKLEIIASEYYKAPTESYRRNNEQAEEDEILEVIENSEESAIESSRSKSVAKENEKRNSTNLAMRNFNRHVQQIFKQAGAELCQAQGKLILFLIRSLF